MNNIFLRDRGSVKGTHYVREPRRFRTRERDAGIVYVI